MQEFKILTSTSIPCNIIEHLVEVKAHEEYVYIATLAGKAVSAKNGKSSNCSDEVIEAVKKFVEEKLEEEKSSIKIITDGSHDLFESTGFGYLNQEMLEYDIEGSFNEDHQVNFLWLNNTKPGSSFPNIGIEFIGVDTQTAIRLLKNAGKDAGLNMGKDESASADDVDCFLD